MSNRSPLARSHVPLALAFGAIALLLIVTNALTLNRARHVQKEVHFVVENELASVALIHDIIEDVEHEAALIEQHVDTTDPAVMREIEEKLASIDADYRSKASDYVPLQTSEKERAQWQLLEKDVAAARAARAEMLALSRGNETAKAHEKMGNLLTAFETADRDAEPLIDINIREARSRIPQIDALQRSMREQIFGLGLLGLALITTVGVLVSRVLKRQDKSLETYACELEDRNRELDAFAGRVAHDLRGPLTTISMAKAAQLSREEQNTLLKKGVDRMETLIRDLLALSGVGTYTKEDRCDPAKVAAQLQDELRPRLAEAHATLRVNVEPGQLTISEGFLRQALWNLVDNSLRYAREEAPMEVEIRGRPLNGLYEYVVSDNGMGMTEQDLQRVFEPFYRGEEARQKPGTGLGLSIVKRVMEAGGGSAAVASTLGKGTTFTLRLPRA